MVTLILVRHGFSEGNKDNRFAGHLDVPLCDVGRQQADLVCEYIINNYKVDAVYSSPMSRAYETVQKVSEKLNVPLIIDQGLIEIHGGEWEGVSFKEIAERDPVFFKKWWENKGTVSCPNGESMEDAGRRAHKALIEICKQNDQKTLVIASHGGVIRSLQCIFEGLDFDNFNDIPWMPNASISIVEYVEGKFIPKLFGFTEHLNGLTTNLQNI